MPPDYSNAQWSALRFNADVLSIETFGFYLCCESYKYHDLRWNQTDSLSFMVLRCALLKVCRIINTADSR